MGRLSLPVISKLNVNSEGSMVTLPGKTMPLVSNKSLWLPNSLATSKAIPVLAAAPALVMFTARHRRMILQISPPATEPVPPPDEPAVRFLLPARGGGAGVADGSGTGALAATLALA